MRRWKQIRGARAMLGLAVGLCLTATACAGADAGAPGAATAASARPDTPAETVDLAAWRSQEHEARGPAAPAPAPVRLQQVRKGALRPGAHVAARFEPEFFFQVGPAWRARAHRFAILELTRGSGRNLAFLRAPLYVFDPRTAALVPAPLDLLPWMRTHPCVTRATEPVAVTVGGNRGTQFDFVVASRPGCTAPWWEIDDGLVFRFQAGEKDRVIVLWVNVRGGVHQLIVDISTVDPARFDAFAAQAGRVLDTVGFR